MLINSNRNFISHLYCNIMILRHCDITLVTFLLAMLGITDLSLWYSLNRIILNRFLLSIWYLRLLILFCLSIEPKIDWLIMLHRCDAWRTFDDDDDDDLYKFIFLLCIMIWIKMFYSLINLRHFKLINITNEMNVTLKPTFVLKTSKVSTSKWKTLKWKKLLM